MDHIPHPFTSQIPPLEVDVSLAEWIPYDFQGFSTFPVRYAFRSENGTWNALSSEQTETVLFSWLYRGLLCQFLGHNVPAEELLEQRKTGTILTTTSLNPLLQDWGARFLALRKENKAAAESLLQGLLDCCVSATEETDYFEWKDPNRDYAFAELLLAIRILIKTLHVSVLEAKRSLDSVGPYDPTFEIALNRKASSSQQSSASPVLKLLIERLRAAGWCPFQAHHLCQSYDYLFLYYLSLLPRSSRARHALCTEIQCNANNVNLSASEYETKHASAGCHCRFIAVSAEDITSIIAEGGIPLVKIQDDSERGISLKVVKADWRTSYVAYSHVWSDGLGNATDNALPQCQIERLRSQLINLPDPTTSQNLDGLGLDQKSHLRTRYRDESYGQLFWLDTLCVPAQPTYHHLRLKTIDHMAAIYALADRVLVLDSELEGQRIAASQATDLLAYAAFSAWNARCWTLQEGALARSCLFQFEDGAFDIFSEDSQWRGPTNSGDVRFPRLPLRLASFKAFTSALSFLATCGGSWFVQDMRKHWLRVLGPKPTFTCQDAIRSWLYRSLRRACEEPLQVSGKKLGLIDNRKIRQQQQMNIEYGARPEEFVKIWNALGLRSTTMIADIHIVLANLLNLNPHTVQTIEGGAGRMVTILKAVGEIPVSLLYNDGPRDRCNETHYNRWIPTSPSKSMLTATPLMTYTGSSLRVDSERMLHDGHSALLIILPTRVPQHVANIKLRVKIAGKAEELHVKLHRSENEQLDLGPVRATCLLLETSQASGPSSTQTLTTRGACLRIRERDFQKQDDEAFSPFDAVYDCPLDISTIPSQPSSSLLSTPPSLYGPIRGTVLATPWTMNILVTDPNPSQTATRRPLESDGNRLILFLAPPIVFVGLLAQAATILFIATLATQHASLTPLGIAALALCFYPPAWPLSIACLIALAARGEFLSPLMKAFFISFYGAVALVPLGMVIWIVASRYAWEAWLETFEEGWTREGSRGWWWRMMRWQDGFYERLHARSFAVGAEGKARADSGKVQWRLGWVDRLLLRLVKAFGGARELNA